MEKFDGTALAELKSRNLPRCQWSDLLKLNDGESLTDSEAADLNAYLGNFLPPSEKCVHCGTRQSGLIGALCGGGFTWGIVTGEGHCGTCGYPARAYHRDFGVVKFLPAILQVHPDELIPAREEDRETLMLPAHDIFGGKGGFPLADNRRCEPDSEPGDPAAELVEISDGIGALQKRVRDIAKQLESTNVPSKELSAARESLDNAALSVEHVALRLQGWKG